MRKFVPAAVVVLLVAAALGLAACKSAETETTASTTDATDNATTESPPTTSEARAFTLEELAEFDGKDGRPAYVAVDGVVYDVSASSKWPDGTHTNCDFGAMAGQDLSDMITKAPPNMRSLLQRMPAVGTLEQS